MLWVGFEPMTPVFERAKTGYVLNHAATVTGTHGHIFYLKVKGM
jgi:hypothetical protein